MCSSHASRRVLAGILASILFALLLLAPAALRIAAAQTAVPTATATAAPTVTPEPTQTLPQLIDTLFTGDAPVETTGELFNRYGIWAGGIVLLIVIGVFGWRYVSGLGSAVEDIGKQHGSGLFRWSPRSNVDRYLEWLIGRCATIKPLGIGGEHVTLGVARVHVPLRFEEVIVAGEAGQSRQSRPRRPEAFQRIERLERINDSYVFTLLSEEKLLRRAGRPNPLQRAQTAIARRFGRQRTKHMSTETEAMPVVTNRLLVLGNAGSGKTTTLRYAALRLADAYRRRKPRLLADANMRLYLSKPPLPIYARLTEFVPRLPKDQRTPPTVEQFLAWLDQTARDGCGDGAPALSRFVADSRALLLLDGLDQAGDEARRADLAALIATLAET